jgi:hypothetical protein
MISSRLVEPWDRLGDLYITDCFIVICYLPEPDYLAMA